MKAALASFLLLTAGLATPALAQGMMSQPDGFTCSCYADIDQPMQMPGGGRSYICPAGPSVMRANLPQRTFTRAGETIIASCEAGSFWEPNDTTVLLRDSNIGGEESGDRQLR